MTTTTHLPSSVGLPPLSVLSTRSTAPAKALPASSALPSRVDSLLLEGIALLLGGLKVGSQLAAAGVVFAVRRTLLTVAIHLSWLPSQ
jgi:hypothetical protein